jgi:hypothetical protein
MKNTVLKILIISISIIASNNLFSQFSGEISFKKTTGTNEINYIYYINNDNIKIEEINSEEKIEGIKLINLASKKINILSPERKLYIESNQMRGPAEVKVKVEKTDKTKIILDKECQKIIVTCKDQDRKVIYWLTKGDYNFFLPMLELINRREKHAVYYQQISNLKGQWPMKSSEYILSTGKLISEMTTSSIVNKEVKPEVFMIPSDYELFKD